MPSCTSAARRYLRRHSDSGEHAARRVSEISTIAHGHVRSGSVPGRARARRRDRRDARGYPRREQLRQRGSRRSDLRRRARPVRRPAAVAVAATTYRAARKAASLARVEYEDASRDPRCALGIGRRELPDAIRAHRARPAARAARAGAAPSTRQRHASAGRITFTSKGRSRWHCRRKTAACWCTARLSIQPKSRSIVAHALGTSAHAVSVQCRRMGGGFGGKEKPGGADRRGRRCDRSQDRPPDQAPARSGCGHDHHGQTPRFRRGFRGRVRRSRAHRCVDA